MELPLRAIAIENILKGSGVNWIDLGLSFMKVIKSGGVEKVDSYDLLTHLDYLFATVADARLVPIKKHKQFIIFSDI